MVSVDRQGRGELEPVLSQLGFNILSTLKLNGFENNAVISDTWLSAYGTPFLRPADCLGAIGWAKGFATDAHRFETPNPAADRAIRGKPALAIWGEADRTLHAEHFLPLFSAIFPAAPVKRLSGVGHYCLTARCMVRPPPRRYATHSGSATLTYRKSRSL
jgi:cis-3-alkyl-4-acyloxetan-2-one decarboxylase